MGVTEKLNGLFRMVFDDDSIDITPKTTADDVDGWDSLSHVNLILAVENAFEIRFAQKELLTFKNVGDMIATIERKVAEKQ